MFRILVLITALLCMTACSSMQVISNAPDVNLARELSSGDKISITTTDGNSQTLTVRNVTAHTVTGIDASGKQTTIRADSIKELEVQKLNAGKTAGVTFASIVAALAVLFGIGVYALTK